MGEGTTPSSFYDKSLSIVYLLIIFGAVFTFFGWMAIMYWVIVGARAGSIFREKYFEVIMKIDPAWLGGKAIAELPKAIDTDTLKIERATGDKLVVLILTSSTILASFALGIAEGLRLTLISLAFCPIVVGGVILLNKGVDQSVKAADISYRKAGAIAEEALQEIKTVGIFYCINIIKIMLWKIFVASLNGQKNETRKYIDSLSENQTFMTMSGLKTGVGVGITMLGFFCCWLHAIWLVGHSSSKLEFITGQIIKNMTLGKLLLLCLLEFCHLAIWELYSQDSEL